MTRKQYSARFKAKVAMEAIGGEKPMNELATRFGLHPTQMAQWKKQVREVAKISGNLPHPLSPLLQPNPTPQTY